jgi:hypothetical protein
MSVFLTASSIVTTLLIPHAAFAPGGAANGRALAYVSHTYLGDLFGTAYDLSTILILWFAGASAMAGLLNVVPRYLPRYGMAPEWARARRPLVLIFALICFGVTIVFQANVEAQAGAYATGVLVLMTSATIAVTLSARRHGQTAAMLGFGMVTLIFLYTTAVTVIERPEGMKIAALFIATIVVTSLLSRVWRTTELRVTGVELDATAQRFIDEASRGVIRIIAHDDDEPTTGEYAIKEHEQRNANCIPAGEPVLFLEVTVLDPSEFAPVLKVCGEQVGPYRVLHAESSSVPNAIAALLLFIRDYTGQIPSVYFAWSEEAPLRQLARFLLFGEGDIPPVTHEILRQAEPNPARRPAVHVG